MNWSHVATHPVVGATSLKSRRRHFMLRSAAIWCSFCPARAESADCPLAILSTVPDLQYTFILGYIICAVSVLAGCVAVTVSRVRDVSCSARCYQSTCRTGCEAQRDKRTTKQQYGHYWCCSKDQGCFQLKFCWFLADRNPSHRISSWHHDVILQFHQVFLGLPLHIYFPQTP